MSNNDAYLFTSESVSEGHPDKVADRISDTVVDAFLSAGPLARVACETLVTTNLIVIAGEVRGPSSVIGGLETKIRDAMRHSGESSGLEPDAKSQVTLLYEDGVPTWVKSIVVSTQHREDLGRGEIEAIVRHHAAPLFPDGMITGETEWLFNPTGNFVIGGPDGDCGGTGHEIIVDTYGGAAPHGGGAVSWEKVDLVDDLRRL